MNVQIPTYAAHAVNTETQYIWTRSTPTAAAFNVPARTGSFTWALHLGLHVGVLLKVHVAAQNRMAEPFDLKLIWNGQSLWSGNIPEVMAQQKCSIGTELHGSFETEQKPTF